MIFVDSNVPMYLVGSPHPNRIAAEQTLAALIARREKLVSYAEVLQEILHRCVSIGRLDAIQPAFDALPRCDGTARRGTHPLIRSGIRPLSQCSETYKRLTEWRRFVR